MCKYNVYDSEDKYLGTIFGMHPIEALKEAKLFGMETAAYVVERIDPLSHKRPKHLN